jgi:hypothetical protein
MPVSLLTDDAGDAFFHKGEGERDKVGAHGDLLAC